MKRSAYNKYWTKALVIAEAKKYISQSEWRKAGGGSLPAARTNGWMKEATSHMKSSKKPKGYWTKERVLEDAKKYSYLTLWINAEQSGYSAAKRNGWLKEACAHMVSPKKRMGYWTKEALLNDARKYQTKSEWKSRSGSAYATALSKGLLEECTSHMNSIRKPEGYWSKNKCLESARKYQTISAWSKAEGNAYDAAKRNGWVKAATAHMVKVFSHGEYTIYSYLLRHNIKFEYQKRFKELKDKRQLPYDFYLNDFNLVIEYQGRQHFGVSPTSLFSKDSANQARRDAIKKAYALNSGMFYIDIAAEKTDEIEFAIHQKLKEISLLQNKSLRLSKRDLTEDEINTLASLGIWTKESVLADAKKYSKTSDWKNCGNSASQIARKKGWYAEATMHMSQSQKPKGYWTKDRVLADAKKYKTKKEWFTENQSGYSTAQAKGWLKEATAHMK
jgi:very-short-patch-repair endonuclease